MVELIDHRDEIFVRAYCRFEFAINHREAGQTLDDHLGVANQLRCYGFIDLREGHVGERRFSAGREGLANETLETLAEVFNLSGVYVRAYGAYTRRSVEFGLVRWVKQQLMRNFVALS